MKDRLVGKGANLAEMTKIGLPVPFGFTVTTEACNRYYDEGKKIGDDIVAVSYTHLDVYKRQVYPSVTALIAENCLADWIAIWKS